MCRSRTHARTAVVWKKKLRALCHELFPFYTVDMPAVTRRRRRVVSTDGWWQIHIQEGGRRRRRQHIGKTEMSCLRRLRKRLRNSRVDSALDVAAAAAARVWPKAAETQKVFFLYFYDSSSSSSSSHPRIIKESTGFSLSFFSLFRLVHVCPDIYFPLPSFLGWGGACVYWPIRRI